jgi:hypothetical protein
VQLSDIRARVSQRLDEGVTGATFYPTAEMNAAINEANRFFCLLTLCLEQTLTWSPSAGVTFTHMLGVFSDWICPLRITDGSGAKIRPATLADLSALDNGWTASLGSPQRYVALGADLIGLYQQPGAGAILTVTYARLPLSLVNDTDVPEIPAEYHPALVKYAIYRLRMVEGAQEFAKALPRFDEFLTAADHYANYVRARNIGSRYDRTPFELESYDRSKLFSLRPDLLPSTETPTDAGTVTEAAK